jgi:hypothetical protein
LLAQILRLQGASTALVYDGDSDALSGGDEVFVKRCQGEAFVQCEMEVGGVVDGEAMGAGERKQSTPSQNQPRYRKKATMPRAIISMAASITKNPASRVSPRGE